MRPVLTLDHRNVDALRYRNRVEITNVQLYKCEAVQMCSCMCEQNPDPEATCERGILSEQCQVSFPSLLNCFLLLKKTIDTLEMSFKPFI